MGRELQKRKNRTKVPTLKKKRKLLHNGDKKINVFGNALIAENWYGRTSSALYSLILIICAIGTRIRPWFRTTVVWDWRPD
jgi:hypothetical protein